MKFFSKIKKVLVSTLMAVSLVLIGAGISACGEGSGKNKLPQLFGFEVGETINVEQYGLVQPVNVHVTDAEGTMYDVVVEVRDSQGNMIFTDEGNKFNAYDAGGYTITYSIETWDFSVAKSVKVVVNAVEEVFDFELKCDTLVSVDDTVTVQAEGMMTNPEYTLSVFNETTRTECETNGLAFTPTEKGIHTVKLTVKADEGTATKEMQLYARAPLTEGEIEMFGDDWLTVRQFSPKRVAMEGTWLMETTADSNIKNIDGEDDTYAVLETKADYTHIYFNIRESRAYYRNLVAKGYTHVRFRVYVDSSTNRGKFFQWENYSPSPTTNQNWRISPANAKAGQWTEFFIPLATGLAGSSDKRPGFVELYDFYQYTWILMVDNSLGTWNPNNKIDEDKKIIDDRETEPFKIYFDDVVAVRDPYDVAYNVTSESGNFDFSSVLNRAWGTKAEDYTYSVNKYEYTATETKKTELIKNQTLTSTMIPLTTLQGNDNAYGSYEVTYFLKAGDPEEYFQKVWLDILNPNEKAYAYLNFHNFSLSRGMIWKNQDPTASVTTNLDDNTITYTAKGNWGAGLQIPPAYSVAYYRELQYQGYVLTFDLKVDVQYVENATEEVKATTYQVGSFGGAKINYKNGETHKVTVNLANIVNYYKELQNVSVDNLEDSWGRYVLFYFIYNDKVYKVDNHESVTFTISNFKMEKQG